VCYLLTSPNLLILFRCFPKHPSSLQTPSLLSTLSVYQPPEQPSQIHHPSTPSQPTPKNSPPHPQTLQQAQPQYHHANTPMHRLLHLGRRPLRPPIVSPYCICISFPSFSIFPTFLKGIGDSSLPSRFRTLSRPQKSTQRSIPTPHHSHSKQ
jgi:hypothetical protein